ncbi:MAG TPA: 23S rRNA (pseudouridine(1915)-N(3))-methyltransferase RlmH [Candidatus Megaira endosymbiont of Hartmannula sinica]|nr:23S rRNA (pseudouridine(1915)-N(3))-methyltransferase RlmH [Candidatus Megaera endosymbiont of Hartmannula sinica]
MQINIISFGNDPEFIKDLCSYYIKISNYYHINDIILKPPKSSSSKPSKSEIDHIKSQTSNLIFDKISQIEKKSSRNLYNNSGKFLNVILSQDGNQIDSYNFTKMIEDITINSRNINFIIGSFFGLDVDLLKKKYNNNSNLVTSISISKMTFPSKIIKTLLLEQIYRSYTIINNISYHK